GFAGAKVASQVAGKQLGAGGRVDFIDENSARASVGLDRIHQVVRGVAKVGEDVSIAIRVDFDFSSFRAVVRTQEGRVHQGCSGGVHLGDKCGVARGNTGITNRSSSDRETAISRRVSGQIRRSGYIDVQSVHVGVVHAAEVRRVVQISGRREAR